MPKIPFEERLLRLPDVLQLIPLSPAAWWRGIQNGKYPTPVKLPNCRSTFWRGADIKKLMGEATFDSTRQEVRGRAAQ